jgi:transposase
LRRAVVRPPTKRRDEPAHDERVAKDSREKDSADLSPVALAAGTPTRSVTQKEGAQETSAMRNIGLDLGAKKISFCEVQDGKVVARRTVGVLTALEDVLGVNAPKATVAIEACREAWHVHDELVRRGHEVKLVDTTRVKKLGIGQHGRKTDRIDAEVLARALESGHIPEAHVLSPHRRALRTHMMVRRALIEMRSQTVTTIRGIVRASGGRIGTCTTEAFVDHYRERDLPEEVQAVCEPLVQVLVTIEPQLDEIDRKISQLAKHEAMIAFLMTAPGVGLMVAAMFVSVVDDAKRFTKAHQVESYLGLVPSEDSSGGKRRIGAISKHGNSYLRALLVQAAWTILKGRPASQAETPRLSDPLRTWADAVAARRGKNVAAIALARRLAGVLWAMWRDGTVYDPEVVGRASAIGKTLEAQSSHQQAVAITRATRKAKRYLRGPAATTVEVSA